MKRHKNSREAGESVIIYPDNYINDIEGEKLEDMCDAYIEKGFKRIIIDFANTDLINSIGVSIIIGIIEKIRDKKGVVAFSSLSAVNSDIFNIVGLTKHVQVYADDDQAIAEQTGRVLM